MCVFLAWKRRCADVRAGTQAPLLRFRLGRLRVGRLMSFGWIACKWLFYLCGITRKCITEIGRGGACVPARVALQGRIHRSIPRAQCVYFRYGNAAARTFGRAHRRRPYAFCLRELCVDVRPYGFVWVDCAWAVGAVWADRAWIYAFIFAAFSMGGIGRNSFLLLIFAMS